MLVILNLLLFITRAASESGKTLSPKECCDEMIHQIPSIVHFPSSFEYETRHSTYYSLQQQELFPACTVKPLSTEDVSRVLQVAQTTQCQFAVASGGHMAWKGSSNLDNGFVLDLRGLNKIEIFPREMTARLGPGSAWTEVYAEMSQYNMTVAGARINAVGVGGFLAGGGFTFKSQNLGFGSNNVINYEIVLANGTVLNANMQNHGELFWALKLAGSNYGIITAFDMRTYQSPAIWGAVSVYPATNQTISEVLTDYETYSHDNNNFNVFKSAVFVNTATQNNLMTVMSNADGIPEPPVTKAVPLQHAEEVGSTHDVVNDVIAAALSSTARSCWFTLTTKVNMPFFLDTNKLASKIFEPVKHCDGLSVAVGAQAFQKSFIEATHDSPVYNSLRSLDEDLTLILIMATWTNPADDDEMEEITMRLGRAVENDALQRDILTDFIYLNYANGRQDVYERSVTPEDLIRMNQVREHYDPNGTLRNLWQGGYKLPYPERRRFDIKDEL